MLKSCVLKSCIKKCVKNVLKKRIKKPWVKKLSYLIHVSAPATYQIVWWVSLYYRMSPVAERRLGRVVSWRVVWAWAWWWRFRAGSGGRATGTRAIWRFPTLAPKDACTQNQPLSNIFRNNILFQSFCILLYLPLLFSTMSHFRVMKLFLLLILGYKFLREL